MRSAIIAMACAVVVVAGTTAFGTSCTTVALPSVRVTVKDAAGSVVGDAKVTYRVDGGAEQQAECLGSTVASCPEWVAGMEGSGTFAIPATSADGTKRAEKAVVVTRDECHVQSEEGPLVLQKPRRVLG